LILFIFRLSPRARPKLRNTRRKHNLAAGKGLNLESVAAAENKRLRRRIIKRSKFHLVWKCSFYLRASCCYFTWFYAGGVLHNSALAILVKFRRIAIGESCFAAREKKPRYYPFITYFTFKVGARLFWRPRRQYYFHIFHIMPQQPRVCLFTPHMT
jgi:uncharacterized membrane protein